MKANSNFHITFIVATLLFLAWCQAASAEQGGERKIPAPVPQTGQIESYSPGDDGDYQMGVPWPEPRFTDNEDGTVRDNLTGLIWLKDANCFEDPMDWFDALDFSDQLADGECGLTDGSSEGDWRLPNIRELQSLIHYGCSSPVLPDTNGTACWVEGEEGSFTNVQYGQYNYYWSSTSLAIKPGYVWQVGMLIGASAGEYEGTPNGGYVWPVRGGCSGGN